MQTKYRPEIDGLRSIAVISVILYHAELLFRGNLLLGGGYIGVDVFFVISGYLITFIILSDARDHRFSFANFYERRARRILPALFTIMLFTLPFAWNMMLPKPMREYATSGLATLGFISNIFFWSENSYWAEPSNFKPLLHTWSLAIEEQFYFLFPPLLFVIYRWAKSHITAILAGLLCTSLAFAEFSSKAFPEAGFFLLPTRGWELLAGALIAKLELDRGRPDLPGASQLLSGIGLVLILYPMMSFSDRTPHPSLYTVGPVLGTALIIYFIQPAGIVYKLLSSRLAVSTGLISYSLYLWHFPILVFARMGNESLSNLSKLGLIAVTFVLSVASYYWIEKPARNRENMPTRRLLIVLGTVFCVLSAIYGGILLTDGAKFRLHGLSEFVSVDYRDSEEAKTLFHTHSTCFMLLWLWDENEPFRACRNAESLAPHNLIMLVGDSHAASLTPGLIEFFGKDHIIQRTAASCLPQVNYTDREFEGCKLSMSDAYKDIESLEPSVIILGGDYQTAEDIESMSALIEGRLAPYKDRLIIMGPLPRWKFLVGEIRDLYKKSRLNFEVPEYLPPRDLTFSLEEGMSAMASELGVTYLSPVDTFCEKRQCRTKIGESPDSITTYDHAHLTHKSSRHVIAENLDLFRSKLEKKEERAR